MDGGAGDAEDEVFDAAGADGAGPAQIGAGEAASDEAGGVEVALGGLDLGELGHGVLRRPRSGAGAQTGRTLAGRGGGVQGESWEGGLRGEGRV